MLIIIIADNQSLLCALCLLEHGMCLCTGAEVDKPDKEEQTALHICVQNAIVHSSYAAVEHLLAAGASVSV